QVVARRGGDVSGIRRGRAQWPLLVARGRLPADAVLPVADDHKLVGRGCSERDATEAHTAVVASDRLPQPSRGVDGADAVGEAFTAWCAFAANVGDLAGVPGEPVGDLLCGTHGSAHGSSSTEVGPTDPLTVPGNILDPHVAGHRRSDVGQHRPAGDGDVEYARGEQLGGGDPGPLADGAGLVGAGKLRLAAGKGPNRGGRRRLAGRKEKQAVRLTDSPGISEVGSDRGRARFGRNAATVGPDEVVGRGSVEVAEANPRL